ncbi:MAG: 50S ribosomal protein L39e [Thaumarchaeota archaeon]|jgi:large subunit ribosomal protein L39e|nr:50S ribosomal protein L39e [Nitrososphaerota archaeon]
MGSVKDKSKKNRLTKARKQASPVPTWVVIKTNRTVRFNPKQRDWRRQKLRQK